MLPRLYAGWLLGWSLLWTLVALVFLRRKRGLRRFERNYRDDRLLALTNKEHQTLPRLGTCISCGLCDERGGRNAFPGLMSFVLSSSRSLPDYPTAAATTEGLDDDWLRRMENRCPANIPFRALIEMVRDYHARLEERIQQGNR